MLFAAAAVRRVLASVHARAVMRLLLCIVWRLEAPSLLPAYLLFDLFASLKYCPEFDHHICRHYHSRHHHHHHHHRHLTTIITTTITSSMACAANTLAPVRQLF